MQQETGEVLPALQRRVRPKPHLMFVWNAFADLGTDRPPSGYGSALPIPWSAIDRYAQRYRIDDPDEFERFKGLVQSMDRALLEREREGES